MTKSGKALSLTWLGWIDTGCKCMTGVARVTLSDSAPVPKIFNPGAAIFFKFGNPTPFQTPAIINDPTKLYPCFYPEMTTQAPAAAEIEKWIRVRFFTNIWLRVRTNKKRRILPESTPNPWLRL